MSLLTGRRRVFPEFLPVSRPEVQLQNKAVWKTELSAAALWPYRLAPSLGSNQKHQAGFR